jgi:hypothetical protein
MFADKPWLYFQNLFQEENKLSEKNITGKTQVSENSKNDIRFLTYYLGFQTFGV